MVRRVIPPNLSPPSAPAGPFADPRGFGTAGAGLQQFGAIVQEQAFDALAEHDEEVDRRNRQRQATQLATLRATAQNQIGDFLQEIERNPDFAGYPQLWETRQQELTASLAQGIDPVVWEAFGPDWLRLTGSATRSVRDLAHAREDDHNVAQLARANNLILDRAGTLGADSRTDLAMIQANYIEAFRSGLISEADSVRFIRRDTEAYNDRVQDQALTAHQVAQDADPLGWLNEYFPTWATAAAPTSSTTSDLQSFIDRQAVFESGGDPQAVNPSASGAAGLHQFIPSTWRAVRERHPELGLPERVLDATVEQQNAAALALAADNDAMFQREMGRTPDDAERSLMWFMGPVAFPILRDPAADLHATIAATTSTGHADRVFAENPNLTRGMANQGVVDMMRRRFPDGALSVASSTEQRPSAAVLGIEPGREDTLFDRGIRRAERELEVMQTRLAGEIQDYQTALINGIEAEPPPDDEIMRAYALAPNEGAEVIRGLRRLEGITDEVAGMHALSNAEIRQMLETERAAFMEGGPDLTERSERLQLLETAGDEILGARTDGAGYVVGRDPILAEAFEQAETAQQWAAAIDLSMRRQMEFVDRPEDARPLPDAAVSAFLGDYGQEEDATGRLRALQVLTLAHDHGAATFDQLEAAGLDPALRWVVAATAREHDPLGESAAVDIMGLIENSEALQEEFDRRYSGDVDRRKANAVPGTEYDERRGSVYANRMAIVGDIRQTTELMQAERSVLTRVSIGLALRTAGAGRDPDIEDATDQAYQMLFGGTMPIAEDLGQAIVPTDGSGTRDDPGALIQRGMEIVRGNLVETFAPETLAPFLGIEPEVLSAPEVRWMAQQIIDDAEWVNHGDGYAIAMPVAGPFGRLLPGPEGEPRVWTGAWLAERGREEIPSATRPDEFPTLDPDTLEVVLPGGNP